MTHEELKRTRKGSARHRTRGVALAAWTTVLACSGWGCATVRPWERDQLSDPIMMFDENPIDAGFDQHHLDYREGSTGATGARSGGCGCG
ncbi:MAG: DUF4266 domain-containing protein [Candidatus Eisenbacteria bacterium]